MDSNDSNEGNRTCETVDDSESQTGRKTSESSMDNNDLNEGNRTCETVDDSEGQTGRKTSESSMDNNDLKEGTQTGETVDDNDNQTGSKINEPSMVDSNSKEDTQTGEIAVDSESQIESKTSEYIIDNDSKEGARTGGTADNADSNPQSTMSWSDMNNKDSKEGTQTEEIIDDADSQTENTISKSCMNKELMEEAGTGETADETNSHPENAITISSLYDKDSAEETQTGESDSHSELTKHSSMNKKDSKKGTQTREAACDTDSQAANTMSESSMDIKDLMESLVQELSSRSKNGQNLKHEEQNQNEQDTKSHLHPIDMTRSGGTKGSPEDESISVLTQEHGRQQPDQSHASDDWQTQQACDENSYGKHPSVKDSEVQFGKNLTDERSDTKNPTFYPKLALVNWLVERLPLIIAIIAIAIALNNHVRPTLHPNAGYTEHSQEPDEFREKLSRCLSRVDSSVQEIKQIKFRLEVIEEKIEKLVVYKSDIDELVKKEDLDNLIRDTEIHLLGLVDVKMEETKKVFQDDVLKLKTEVDAKVHDLKEKQERKSQCLEKKNAEMVSEMSKLQSIVQNLKDDLVGLSKSHDKNNSEVAMQLSQHKEILTGLKQSEETLGNRVKHIANETTTLNNATDYIMENLFHKGSMIVVIMINTSLVVMVIIYLYSTRGTHRYINQNVNIEQAHDGVNHNPSPYSTAGKILSKVRTHPRLERKLCIISFYEETHPLHMRMIQSVTQQLNKELVEFIIRRHEDILEIPKVFLYFLFVDFNERNVILEDPALGLGDLRLTTVQVIQKISGRIVILYVKDPNSRQLDSRKLYNKNLASVTMQRELSALNRISRFISSYESLTDFQEAHLRLIVENELEGR